MIVEPHQRASQQSAQVVGHRQVLSIACVCARAHKPLRGIRHDHRKEGSITARLMILEISRAIALGAFMHVEKASTVSDVGGNLHSRSRPPA